VGSLVCDRKKADAEKAKRWRQRNPEACRASKRRYYASEKGRACKQREEAAFVATGGRAAAAQRRASKPLSEARQRAKQAYQLMRRAFEKELPEFDRFVLSEAVGLARLRSRICGGEWHVDHIRPVSREGRSSFDNLQVVPALWNRSKSNKHTRKFLGSKES